MGFLAIALLAAAGSIPPGTYTNEEEVYFASEANKPPPVWIAIRADANGWRTVDAYDRPVAPPAGLSLTPAADGVIATLPDGTRTTLRRGRPATCWVAARKAQPKADGGDDYAFQGKLRLHDQGGRALAGSAKDSWGAPPVVIRMRNVIWPSGNNRPSLVMYVHKPDQPDRAEAYAWADPGAARVGVNLRWVQASCTIDGQDAPAASSKGGQ